MQITITSSTDLSRFVGGSMEISTKHERQRYQGQIESIRVERSSILVVRFDWMAQAKGYTRETTTWHRVNTKGFRANLQTYSISDVGAGSITLVAYVSGVTAFLYPKGDSRCLRPSRVQGLS